MWLYNDNVWRNVYAFVHAIHCDRVSMAYIVTISYRNQNSWSPSTFHAISSRAAAALTMAKSATCRIKIESHWCARERPVKRGHCVNLVHKLNVLLLINSTPRIHNILAEAIFHSLIKTAILIADFRSQWNSIAIGAFDSIWLCMACAASFQWVTQCCVARRSSWRKVTHLALWRYTMIYGAITYAHSRTTRMASKQQRYEYN